MKCEYENVLMNNLKKPSGYIKTYNALVCGFKELALSTSNLKPDRFQMHRYNWSILYGEDFTKGTIYCQSGNCITGFQLQDFILLAKGSSYIVRSAGTAMYTKYFYHIPTKQVYGLYKDDYSWMCIAKPIAIDAQEYTN
ncbi:hypothetical protein [Sabulibacter ruber]|uniref:hypothetical protein n=1 Tax=Sabulibacter ruber TaxID=2811901 RepID=UPI001A95EAE2|nr:hypothetical protein [Sabulibacter ruber]